MSQSSKENCLVLFKTKKNCFYEVIDWKDFDQGEGMIFKGNIIYKTLDKAFEKINSLKKEYNQIQVKPEHLEIFPDFPEPEIDYNFGIRSWTFYYNQHHILIIRELEIE